MQVLSSLSGIPFYAPSAGYAPTNGADVSAIASAYADPKLDATASAQFQPSGDYLSATESSNYYPTSNPSGFVTGIDLSDYVEKSSISAESSTWNNVTAKQDASAMTGYIPTSESTNYYPASNPSGFISSVDLSDYATTSYVDSSVSSKLDTTAFSDVSGSFLTAVPEGYATESYVDSAVSGKLDVTASSQFLTSLPDDLAYTSDVASAVSGKLDASASSDFYPMTGNPSGFLTAHQSLDGYATVEYVDSSVSGKLDTSAYDSAEFYTTANPSGFITGVDLTDYATTAYVDSSISSFVDSAYVESQVSGKQDTLNFDWDSDSAISSINGSALAGQGGASIPFTGYYWDSAASATVKITADVTAVSSLSYTKYNGTVVNAYKGITDSLGIHHLGVASFIDAGAEINGRNYGIIPYTMSFAPRSSMWTTADAATGIFAPLQYGTGAGMFMESNDFKGYLKCNEWFVSDDRYGYARGEVHNSRGCQVIVEHTGGAVAVLSARGSNANVTLKNTSYGTAKMAVANSQAYVLVQRGNNASKYNSAKLDTDYLKFYNGMTTGYLDPEDTASGTAYMSAQTEYMYISSIPYWNAKLDTSAIECDADSAITAIGGSSVGGESYTSPSGTIVVNGSTLEGTDSGVGTANLTSFQKSGYFDTAYGLTASGSSNTQTVFKLSASSNVSVSVSSNGSYYTSVKVSELNGDVIIPSGSWKIEKTYYNVPTYWTACNYFSGTADVELAHKTDIVVTSITRDIFYDYSTTPTTTGTAVTAINGELIRAESALSAGTAELALYTRDGTPLTAFISSMPISQAGTIHITGMEIEGSDSAFVPDAFVVTSADEIAPNQWQSASSATGWGNSVYSDSPNIKRIDISAGNQYGTVTIDANDYYNYENNYRTSYSVSPYETGIHSIALPFSAGSVHIFVASFDTSNPISSVPFTAYSQGTGTVIPLAHASALPTYGYDGATITSIDGSAVGGAGGVDSATVSAIASAYAESAVSSVSGDYYSTSNPSGFITGVDLSNYATTAYVDSSVSSKQDSSAMTAYVEKTAYDNLYSAFTALNDIISTYSGYFSSISSKVDNSAIGVV